MTDDDKLKDVCSRAIVALNAIANFEEIDLSVFMRSTASSLVATLVMTDMLTDQEIFELKKTLLDLLDMDEETKKAYHERSQSFTPEYWQ